MSPVRWSDRPRYLTPPDVYMGAFLTDAPIEHVVCGVCRAEFLAPHEKAQHLVMVHGAVVRKRIDPEGNELYAWHVKSITLTPAEAARMMSRRER